MKKYLPAASLPEYLLRGLPVGEREALKQANLETVFIPQETISKGIGFEPNPDRKFVDLELE